MNKEIQDLAWSVLPKEFKEEVKKIYAALLANIKMYRGNNPEQVGTTDPILWERTLGIKNTLCRLFGEHNLTSDAEGEEMLTVSRKQVLEIYQYNEDILSLDPTHSGAILLKGTFQELFGSKCLPETVDTLADNVDSLEQKPADLNTDRPTCTDVCSSKIDELRLRIAAQMVPHVIATVPLAETDKGYCSAVAVRARILADAFIAECMHPTDNN